jgi:YidC/Oxa1 family membrane protein insertase
VKTAAGYIAGGATTASTMRLYAGPQEQDQLAELAPGLDLTTDYGWLTAIAAPLFRFLSFLHGWSATGGWRSSC